MEGVSNNAKRYVTKDIIILHLIRHVIRSHFPALLCKIIMTITGRNRDNCFSLQKTRTFKDLNLKEGLTNKVINNISQHLGFVLNCTTLKEMAIVKGIWGLFSKSDRETLHISLSL